MDKDLKVSFYLKKNEVDSEGTAPVMGRIRIGKTEAPFSAKAKIRLSLWDTHSGRAAGKSAEATQLNRKLDTMNGVINARYRELLKTGENVTAEALKAAFQGIASHRATLIEYFENYLAEYKKRVGIDREAATYAQLEHSLSHLRKFLKKKYGMKDIPFTSLTDSFIEDYDLHLRINLGFAANTAAGLISTMRRMIKFAVNESIISYDPFYRYKSKYSKPKQKYLTEAELESIIDTTFDKPGLAFTKDMFLFSCFTGFAYRDICNLTEKNIVKAQDDVLWIKTTRQKTGVPSNVPLLEIPLQIIEKYGGTTKPGKLFPMTSNSCLNGHLKKIASRCGIGRNIVFHSGRHTYASTITLSRGVPIETVSSMLGHKDLNTTNIYAKITYEKIMRDMETLEKRIENRYELTQINNTHEIDE